MRSQRPRRYVAPSAFRLLRIALRFSASRDAYVLRFVGNRHGPVLRVNRRHHQQSYEGPDRRAMHHAGGGLAVRRRPA